MQIPKHGDRFDLVRVKNDTRAQIEPMSRKLAELMDKRAELDEKIQKLSSQLHQKSEYVAGINGHISQMDERKAETYRIDGEFIRFFDAQHSEIKGVF